MAHGDVDRALDPATDDAIRASGGEGDDASVRHDGASASVDGLERPTGASVDELVCTVGVVLAVVPEAGVDRHGVDRGVATAGRTSQGIEEDR
jgi:hypothetical protein